jgi:GTP cyclohydrolase I
VAYIPGERVVGLSKLNRIVDHYAKRPQVQERLTRQIAESLRALLETDDIAVMIDAKHLCVSSRGIQDEGSSTVTSFLSGAFEHDESIQHQFYAQIQGIH